MNHWERPGNREKTELSVTESEALMAETISAGLEKKELPRFASLGLLLDKNGKPILVERKTPPHEGLFSVVGGKIDQAEREKTQFFRSPTQLYLQD
ncbi:MAG: hypothetical protein JW816_03055 [Candidatus Buchananbacteria bacterium]|nr:hypothetical protein [Candidatus Buchananbacteria bacterium]